MNQSDIFCTSEADAYTRRNAAHNAAYRIEDDIVAQCIEQAKLQPKKILDLGCSTGERLEALCDRYEVDVAHGVDASLAAIRTAKARHHERVGWWVNDWTSLDGDDHRFDLVITSFVWHWVDRSRLLLAMARVDEALRTGGHLVINDWHMTADVPYAHAPGITTYKRYYPDMFLATGLYEIVMQWGYPYRMDMPEPCAVTILRRK